MEFLMFLDSLFFLFFLALLSMLLTITVPRQFVFARGSPSLSLFSIYLYLIREARIGEECNYVN